MGNGGQLRAYDPIPVNGRPVLRWSASIGNATNYSTPGVAAGQLYVGTRDGKVLAFGSPVSSPLGGSGLSFPRTTKGSSSAPQTLTITANRSLTVNSLTSSDPSEFVLGTPSPSTPATLTTGEQITVPVTFKPGQTGTIGGQVTASTNAGDVPFSLQGTGQVNGPSLAASEPVISLGGTAVGGHLSGSVFFSNVGSQTLTIQSVQLPSVPFSSPDAPGPNTTIAPGASITADISFDPTSGGQFTPDKYTIVLDSTGGDVSVGLSASAGTPGALEFSRQAINFGATQVGTTATQSFTITNTGETAVTINRSKPPFGGAFAATTTLSEGTSIASGQTVTESVTFSPTTLGAASGGWDITGNDGTGLHQVQFSGTGASPSSTPPGGGTTPPPAKKASLPVAPKLLPGVATTAHLGSIYIAYTAKLAGVSRFVLQRAIGGRRGTHGCVATTARNRSRPTCTRFVNVASFTHRGRAGANRLRLGAFVALRKLVPGRYRLQAVLLDSAGGKHTFDTPLRIILPPRRHATRSVAPAIAPLGDLLRQLAALLVRL
jgi:iron transport multicopper oxidase